MQWIKCSDSLPTEADGDESGTVVCRDRCGTGFELIVCILANAGRYDEWLAGACEREQQEQERSE